MSLRTARSDIRLIAELLTTAEQEAHALGDAEPGAEHLLLAALHGPDASARVALAADAAAVRAAIASVHADSLAAVGIEAPALSSASHPVAGVYRSEVSARDVFQRARVLSRGSRSGLRTAHVLIAAAEREHGTAALVLQRLGVDRAAVITAATAAIAAP